MYLTTDVGVVVILNVCDLLLVCLSDAHCCLFVRLPFYCHTRQMLSLFLWLTLLASRTVLSERMLFLSSVQLSESYLLISLVSESWSNP